MNRRLRLLLGISATVGVTLLLGWILVQAFVIRPAIGGREQARTLQAIEAAERMRGGMDKKQVEALRGVDLRVFPGTPDGPPPGEGWIRADTDGAVIWKRDGGKYDIAVWTGEVWVVLHEDFPFTSTLALALLAAGLPVGILVFGLGRRAQRHHERAERALARMAEGDLGERLNERAGGREARRMAVSVNRMAAKVEALLESDRQRAAGLSHELRTPLTRIRLELELARRDGAAAARLDRVERDIEVFDTMLTEMLELSRLQMVGHSLTLREPVDLHGLARMVVDEEGVEDVEIRGTGSATVDARLAARLLRNLLRNSIQHAPESQRWIEIADDRLSVGDDGPGIPVERHAQVSQAFERGQGSAGHGLGLAIVAQIVELHGGTLRLSEPPGLVVEVGFSGA